MSYTNAVSHELKRGAGEGTRSALGIRSLKGKEKGIEIHQKGGDTYGAAKKGHQPDLKNEN